MTEPSSCSSNSHAMQTCGFLASKEINKDRQTDKGMFNLAIKLYINWIRNAKVKTSLQPIHFCKNSINYIAAYIFIISNTLRHTIFILLQTAMAAIQILGMYTINRHGKKISKSLFQKSSSLYKSISFKNSLWNFKSIN